MRTLLFAVLVMLVLACVSLLVGVTHMPVWAMLAGSDDGHAARILAISRIPRTLALVLAGASMAIAGLIMQMMIRNRFAEPTTSGTVEAASLGLLIVTIMAPELPVMGKMLVAAAFALAGTLLFVRLLRLVPLRDPLMVPLLGIMLGGVIHAVATFIAYRFDLLQSLLAWTMGDFSGVLRGRYELLWVGGLLAAVAWIAADRFTVAGLGRDFTTNLGLNYKRVLALGLVIVSMVTSAVVVTVGMIPFLGLIVPNVVSLTVGDNMRRAVPWVAVLGAIFVLSCDILGRIIREPYEIPLGTVVGVVGSAMFLWLVLRKRAHAA
ncbi:iron ABC transporter permease [Rhodomicrobium udaipurense JA643]|uniref:ABC transporter permease n=1 Tax=Rhodomicrobium udaipurense TaxID=1202716 RepID=A0A8I1G7T3_9HYPH|nr:ABC transporter permease [Rhodomicrobium udaipurense]KAI95558.1 iron ABC transporter permease [Rhodomicrobium udaipurense JA643]MBJ7542133.1 ABC transporter permease [Rhodomicrobium udaipurense]